MGLVHAMRSNGPLPQVSLQGCCCGHGIAANARSVMTRQTMADLTSSGVAWCIPFKMTLHFKVTASYKQYGAQYESVTNPPTRSYVVAKYLGYGYTALICTFHSLDRCELRLDIMKEMGTVIKGLQHTWIAYGN